MKDKLIVHLDNKPIYDITFNDSFDKLPDTIHRLGYEGIKLCIVSETNVASLYLDAILISLRESGYFSKVVSFVFPAGEESKNLDVVSELYERLIIEQFDRKDVLIALGGGVTGDLTGFAAATYLRGIDFIQVPTSLLSQVDSSVGGKTGVDFKAYKNMVGAFYMPKHVYMNLNTLKTLDRRQLVSGMGEVVKYGISLDRELYDWIKANHEAVDAYDYEALSYMVYRSCDNKRLVVEEDPTEKGRRALLNFGHTLGHAIEKYMNFSLMHGECVFIGMMLAAIISRNKGNIDEDELADIIGVIKLYEIPKLPEDIDISTIIEYTKNDKKAVGPKIKFILLNKIGEAYIDMDVTKIDMTQAFEQYMQLLSNNKDRKIKILIIPIIIIALLTAIDQFSKFYIRTSFKLSESHEVIKGVFAITYIQNKGAAWGIMQGQRIFFLILTTVIILFAAFVLYNIFGNHKYIMLTITLIILISGAIGNMIDRFKYGYVVDFFDFKLIDFPIFNVADIYVTCSMILIFILLMFVYKDEDIGAFLGKNVESGYKASDRNKDEIDIDIEDLIEDKDSDDI